MPTWRLLLLSFSFEFKGGQLSVYAQLPSLELDFEWVSWEAVRGCESHSWRGRLEERPDPDTGLTGEWITEYKVWSETGGRSELTEDSQIAKGVEELQSVEDAAEAFKNISDAAGIMAGNTTAIPAAEEGATIKAESAASTAPEMDKHKKTIDAIKNDARKPLRNLGEIITSLKSMFEDSQGGKYTAALHDDITACIPRVAKVYTSLEKLVTKKITDEPTI
eukprot:4625823-Pyramimonas_sp.AAC.2